MQIETLRSMQLQARKEKNTVVASLLTTLISEVEMKGKNDGNRLPTPGENIAVIKKFLDNTAETMKVLPESDPRYAAAVIEKTTLEGLLPKQMDDAVMRMCVQQLIDLEPAEERGPKMMGVIMGKMKALYDGQYDGKALSGIVKELLA